MSVIYGMPGVLSIQKHMSDWVMPCVLYKYTMSVGDALCSIQKSMSVGTCPDVLYNKQMSVGMPCVLYMVKQ